MKKVNKNGSQELTPISSLGEFGLIDHLTKAFAIGQVSSKLGVGDDAAILDFAGKQVLVTTDLLVEGIHFDLSYVPMKHLGYKAVVVNISDVCAMNARATQITVSLAVSSRFSLEALDALYDGIRLACKHYNVDLVGGDTSSSLTGMVLSVTAIGMASADKIVKRSGASVNDLICVSGDLGAAYMGLQLLEREKKVFEASKAQAQLQDWEYIVGRQLKPEARHDVVEQLDKLGVMPTSMIDVSDGLSSELLHLAKHSGCGMKVMEDKLPIDEQTEQMAKELSIDPTVAAMNGGEDYELLFTVKPADFELISEMESVSIIGYAIAGADSYLVARDGTAVPMVAQGWNHSK